MTDVIVLTPDATDVVVVPVPTSTSVEVIDGVVHVHHHYDGGGGGGGLSAHGQPDGYVPTAQGDDTWAWSPLDVSSGGSVHLGEGPPPDLIVGARVGDIYIDTLTADLYQLGG